MPAPDERGCPYCAADIDIAAGIATPQSAISIAALTAAMENPGWLTHLYTCRSWSIHQIAARTGLGRQRVSRILKAHGVTVSSRGAGRPRPGTRRAEAPDTPRRIRELYENSRLSSREVAEILGLPERTVRERLRMYGVTARTRGGWNREDRTTVPADVLTTLYLEDGMTAAEVGAHLGVSANTVLRSAHTFGLPVRAGGAVPLPGPEEIQLISALYADSLIDSALTAHSVPRIPPGGTISERFPEPVPLTTPLLKDLYWGCGAGLSHIELVTGQAAESIRGFMRRAGIPLRPSGGRSPFLRRWRDAEQKRSVSLNRCAPPRPTVRRSSRHPAAGI
ncbi:MAG TPA: winged helix-turn-helix transcriptional regulator [Trebonia sp.]|jgi:plasmid maintenance system antidote protein VapI